MSDLVSVGGICFVSCQPVEKPQQPAKRKYRPRGERSRQEQKREASRKYYYEHRAEIARKQKIYQSDRERWREIQRKWREKHRQEINAKARQYYHRRKTKALK